MQLIEDRRLDFNGLFGSPSWCWLRVYQGQDQNPQTNDTPNLIVVLIEPIDTDGGYANRGTSINSFTEGLADLVRSLVGGVEVDKWIYHYPTRNGYTSQLKEDFILATFEQTTPKYLHPSWDLLGRADVEELIGGPFAPLAPVPPATEE